MDVRAHFRQIKKYIFLFIHITPKANGVYTRQAWVKFWILSLFSFSLFVPIFVVCSTALILDPLVI